MNSQILEEFRQEREDKRLHEAQTVMAKVIRVLRDDSENSRFLKQQFIDLLQTSND